MRIERVMKNVCIVGGGLYGATVAAMLCNTHKVTVFESRDEVGGNVATYLDDSSNTHVSKHGAHIFHTNSPRVWDFANRYAEFNSYKHYVKGMLPDGSLVDLPFNLGLFESVIGIGSPVWLKKYLGGLSEATEDNLEAHCISKVGRPVYEAVVKNYTEKQWGRPCSQLPKSIISRLPIRFTHDRTYFNNAVYQGMPILGYSDMVGRMLSGSHVNTGVKVDLTDLRGIAKEYDHVFYSGPIDRLFNYDLGILPYRGLSFEDTLYKEEFFQGAPVINDLSKGPSTRTIEHKMFYPEREVTGYSLVTREFPKAWVPGDEPYYPIRDQDSTKLHAAYLDKAASTFGNVTVGGRLGAFMYYDMDQVIAMAMKDADDYQ